MHAAKTNKRECLKTMLHLVHLPVTGHLGFNFGGGAPTDAAVNFPLHLGFPEPGCLEVKMLSAMMLISAFSRHRQIDFRGSGKSSHGQESNHTFEEGTRMSGRGRRMREV